MTAPTAAAAVHQGGFVRPARPTMAMRATSEMKGALPRRPGQPRRGDAGSPAGRAHVRCSDWSCNRAVLRCPGSSWNRAPPIHTTAHAAGSVPATRPNRHRMGCDDRGPATPRRRGPRKAMRTAWRWPSVTPAAPSEASPATRAGSRAPNHQIPNAQARTQRSRLSPGGGAETRSRAN